MYKIHNFLIAFLIIWVFGTRETEAQNRIIVEPGTCYIDANASPYNKLVGGDTLFFRGGSKQYIQLKNFHGTPRLPIVFVNLNGMVTINTTFYYGIKIANCRYIRFAGIGDTRFFYGFMIQRVTGGAGLSIGELSSDVEIDHISIANCPIAGIYAKTDPDCSYTSTRGKFTQYNTILHDNFISNVGDEGMYIGSSFYSGETLRCNGKDTLVYPHVLEGVKIYNNIVKYTGWDGIQVGSATKNCSIFNNLVMYDSQAGQDWQMSGILIGGGSGCDCYNNYIYKGKGDGIENLGIGNYKIYNNVIVDAGRAYCPNDPSKMKYGIYTNDVSTVSGNSFSILFNDIINPKTNGIRFASIKSKNNLIASNAIISPGAGSNGYIVISSPSCEVLIKNNYQAMSSSGAGFADTTYALLKTSPLIDAGYSDNKGITYDYFCHPRPFGNTFDIGINEFNPKYATQNKNSADILQLNDTAFSMEKKSSLRIDRLPFPNPAYSKVSLSYTVDSTCDVFLDIYNYDGAQIHHFEEDGMNPGTHIVDLDIGDYPEGICLFTLRAGREAISGKFVKVK
ncbi:MAG: right-handed parallel beta-helix repeat-containing protein [Bacteroidetes bacterium]|nr:right-handed parallel beta-helix repeat-containing protein [Bacteroidota bacterium]